MRVSRRRIAEACLVVVLLAAHGWLAVSSAAEKSVTFDEVAHLGGGILSWKTGDHRFNAESGILPQRWAALPLLAQPVNVPDSDHPALRQANVWVTGREILYTRGNDHDALVGSAQGMIAAASAALGAAVWAGSRSLFGPAGGLLSLALYAFSPTMLAHGRLVTADLFAALFFVLASMAIWRLLQRVTPARLLTTVAAVAGLLLSKHSGLLILPIAAILTGLRLLRRRPLRAPWGGGGRGATVVVLALVIGLGVTAAIWAAYGFRYPADPAAEGDSVFLHSWDSVLAGAGPGAPLVGLARQLRILPEAYLWGLAYTLDTTRERDGFLAGRYRKTGWWWFFPYALAVKTPLTLFALLLLAAAAWLAGSGRFPARPVCDRLRQGFYRTAPLWTLLAVYWAVAIGSGLNIGHRHLLPTYPVMFLLAGGAAVWLRRRTRTVAVLVALLAGFFAFGSWTMRPHYLAYFNRLAGGPGNGYRHLVDSSLDWGQDLPALAAWVEDFRAGDLETPIFVSYFGAALPAHYGLERSGPSGPGVRWRFSYFPVGDPGAPPTPLTGGVYCVSATLLQSLHLQTLGHWNAERERQYQERRRQMARFLSLYPDAGGRKQLSRERTEEEWIEIFRSYERLVSARLFKYLLGREPLARAGYSIHIYRLSDAEVQEALSGPPPAQTPP